MEFRMSTDRIQLALLLACVCIIMMGALLIFQHV
jgi:hypothetical protein